MRRVLTGSLQLAAVLMLTAGLSAQADHASAGNGVAGTWDMSAMSHQFALVIDEVTDPQKVTATLMIMGQDVPLDGDFTDGVLTLGGQSKIGAPGSHEMVPLKLTGHLVGDDKMEGEIGTAHGPATWTAERLKKKS